VDSPDNNVMDWLHTGTTADMPSHDMVPSPLFSHLTKKQFCVCVCVPWTRVLRLGGTNVLHMTEAVLQDDEHIDR
jgi:hypothetical protein